MKQVTQEIVFLGEGGGVGGLRPIGWLGAPRSWARLHDAITDHARRSDAASEPENAPAPPSRSALVMLDLPSRRRIRRDELCQVLCRGPLLGSALAPPNSPSPDLPRRALAGPPQGASRRGSLPIGPVGSVR